MTENKLKSLVNRIAKGRPKPSAPRAGYLAGDSARALAEVICDLGCPDCRR